jgi:hypothetical protein
VQKDWKQTSGDAKVVLDSSKTSADVDFANVLKKANGKDHDKDNDNDDHATSTSKGDNGNHFGWYQVKGTFAGWLHLGKNK